jgi:hypothetical protein
VLFRSYYKNRIKLSDVINQLKASVRPELDFKPDDSVGNDLRPKPRMEGIWFWGVTVLVIVSTAVVFYWVLLFSPVKVIKSAEAVPPTASIQTATPIPVVMSEAAVRFFLTLWGLHGDNAQKAELIGTAPVPIGLENDAATVLDAYQKLAGVEKRYNACLNIDHSLSGCAKETQAMKKAQSDFDDVFVKECAVFKAYYQSNNEPWPSPQICKQQ